MSLIEWTGFHGENRAVQPLKLKEGICTISRNQKPGRGDLRPWRKPLAVATVPADRKTIYRMGRDVASDADYWLSWPTFVRAMRSFSTTDTTERTFFTGDGPPKVTDNIMALASAPFPTTSRPAGLPVPIGPLLATTQEPEEGESWAGEDANFYYVYTYVNDWGWESSPSPPSLVNTRPTDAPADLSSFSAVPAGNYHIDKIRIYRTQADETGAAEYFFLREIEIGTDTTVDDNRQLGRVMATLGWFPPPDDLAYLTPMWNGMAAGISEGVARVCEPYSEYAWPLEYEVMPPEGRAVALGVFEQNLLVLTDGRPVLAVGTSPDGLDQMPIAFAQGCVAPRSAVSMGRGVAWASNDGLCWYGSGGPAILTANILLREDWQALNPASIIGCMYEGFYFGSYDDGSGRKGFMIDPANPVGMFFLDEGFEGMHFDELQDQMYVLDGTQVKRWDAGEDFMTLHAASKVWRLPAPDSFGFGEVVGSEFPITLHVDALDLKPRDVTNLSTKRPGVFTALDATTLRHTVTVLGEEPFRLPALVGAKWRLSTEGDKPLQAIAIASDVDELVREEQ